VNLGDSAGVLWWSSGPEDGSRGSGSDWWSPSQWRWLCFALAMGKTAEGAHLWFLYRGESLGAHGEMPKIHPSNESKIAPKFVTDSIGFGS
jgi:hypothetical protein